jgi:oligopeptide transport system permease protein
MAQLPIDLATLPVDLDPNIGLAPPIGSRARRRFFGRTITRISVVVLVLLVTVAAISLVWTPYPIFVQGTAAPYDGPSAKHWLGVDAAGRDLLSRLMVGARISIIVGLGTQFLAVPFGVAYGFLAAYRGGRIDAVGSMVINVFYGIPGILIAMLLVLILGPGLDKIIVAIAITSWMDIARIARGQLLSIKERPYIEAAHAVGLGGIRIVRRHILPNCLGPLIVSGTYGLAAAILSEAFLSYLGLGVAPPTPSWGSMAAEGFAALRIAPHMVIAPTIAISVTLVTVSFVGDALADALDATGLARRR